MLTLFVILMAALPFVIDLLTRVEFPPPPPGSAIVITGASTGIGRHAAEWMANKGFVVYAGIRKDSDAESIRGVGIATLVPVKLDVTDKASIASAVDFVSANLQRRGIPLAGLVNNAGVGTGKSIEFADISSWKWMFDVNVFGVARCTQAFLPLLRQGKGRIVQMSSLAGLVSNPLLGTYSSSKWALEAMSHSLRQELYPQGISVSVINPALVKSEIHGKSMKQTLKPEEKKLYGMFETPELAKLIVKKADEPVVTSEAVEHALTAHYPKTQYIVANFDGRPAWLLARLVWLLPTRVVDAFGRLAFHID